MPSWAELVIEHGIKGPRRADLPDRIDAAWASWATRLGRFIEGGLTAVEDELPQFNDLVLAAAGRLPSRLLHHDLAAVGTFGWTEFALAAVASQWPQSDALRSDRTPEYAPAWAAIAALRILGFGRGAMERMLEHTPRDNPRILYPVQAFLPTATGFGAGILIVAAEPLKAPPDSAHMLLRPETLDAYMAEVTWLGRIGVIRAGAYQRG